MRLLFVSDEHGSVTILRKSIAAVHKYRADALILAGDLCGKQLIPIVKTKAGSYFAGHRKKEEFTKSDIEHVENDLQNIGHYFFHCDERQLPELRSDDRRINDLFLAKAKERLDLWRTLIQQSLDLRQIRVFITPGNDDPLELDPQLRSFAELGIFADPQCVYMLGRNAVVTLDYTPPTPWQTPRETNETELTRMIRQRMKSVSESRRAIFNFHSPPQRTRVDLVANLDKELKPIISMEGENRIHVGSEAVRKAIEEFQPVLGLHGHIHESPGEDRIGPTVCLNPGSEYWNGILHAYMIDLDDIGDVVRYQRIEG